MSWLGKKAADVVTSGQQLVNGTVTAVKLAAGAVVAHLGYTPVNKAGDTMTGDLQIAGAKLDLRSAPGDTNGLKAWMDVNGIGYINAGYSVSDLELQTAGVTRIKASRNGHVTMPNQPCFSAVGGTDHNGNSGWVSSLNPMKFPTAYQVVNVGGHMNGTTGIFTCPVAGIYEVQLSVLMGQNGYGQLGVKKNGVVVRDSFVHANNMGSAYYTTGGKIFVQCSANDQLTIGDVATYSGTGLYISAHGSCSIRLVG